LQRDEDKEQHLVFNFDDEWFTAYGEFVDSLKRIVQKYQLPDDDLEAMVVLGSPHYIVDVMLHEDVKDFSLTEHMMDETHELFSQDVAGDFLEALVDFINGTKKPDGYHLILEIIKRNYHGDDYFCLTQFEGFREEDSQAYTLQYYA